MEPITLIVLGAGGYYIWKKNQNPEWSPLTWITSTPLDKHVALERVKVASVPTPAPTAALDPGMSTDQVKAVNHALTTETDHEKIKAHADALGTLGHASSAAALDAKARAVGEAKAHGASDVEIHEKQIEASAPAAAVGLGKVFGPQVYGYPWGGDPEFDYSYHAASGAMAGADSVFGTHSYGYPWADVSYGHAMHPAHMAGIQSGPAIVGIQSGPAIVGIQSGPAIVGMEGQHLPWGFPEMAVGWNPWEQHRRGGSRFEERFGRHGRYLQRGRERFEHRRPEWERERWRHHRHFRRPEEEVVVEEPEPMPEPEPEPIVEEVVAPPEEIHVEHHHHHEHREHEHHEPPPPPPPQVSITPGTITNGEFLPIEWPEEFVGVAQYGGGGLVAEFPGVPQQAQPYGAPVGQYQQQQYVQQYPQPAQQYGEDLLQEYAQAIEPQLEAYYQRPQYYPQQRWDYWRGRSPYRHYGHHRRWW